MIAMSRPAISCAVLAASIIVSACGTVPTTPRRAARLRIATFNASLSRDSAGQLIRELAAGSEKATAVATIVQKVRPDILVLQELDSDPSGASADFFRSRYLAVPHGDAAAIDYPYRYVPTSNTGIPSGHDLDGDGRNNGPADALGFGRHPGHFGFAVFSRHPIDVASVRSFRTLPWSTMPDNAMPDADRTDLVRAALPLSSKTHVDIPIRLPDRRTLHLLVCHPTPPVFDGTERRNARRNHDEIRLFADYLDPQRSTWIRDDDGRPGGLIPGASFVICGDMNCDPQDGDSFEHPIRLLLDHPAITSAFVPRSAGGVDAARRDGGKNAAHVTSADSDTSDFDDDKGPGNLRVDYVLPSREFVVEDGGVFWPASDDPDAKLVLASDHRMVWLDLR